MRAMWRAALLLGLALLAGLSALAQEEIRRFDVSIEVEQDGDILVTETIKVNVEGNQVRRGIFREFVRYYAEEDRPGKLPYRYDILSVTKDGVREPYTREADGNAVMVRIGDPDVYLEYREHTYEIRYRVKNQIRYRDDFDELYWNVTGTYWQFPIQHVQVVVTFPEGARVLEQNGYTGGFGAADADYTYRQVMDAHVFDTDRALTAREGLTISLTLPKGVIDPPSWSDESWLWWARHGALAALIASLLGLLGFYYRSFDKVGRDPPKGPVFPRYEPPEGYSPAAAHHIYYRMFNGHDGLIAGLMYLASQGHMGIHVDKDDKKKTTLTKGEQTNSRAFPAEIAVLYDRLFAGGKTVKLGETYDAEFT
ncbi:MAG: DUF2207 domain-containing protein, partial [Pseudomonadota bacterium]